MNAKGTPSPPLPDGLFSGEGLAELAGLRYVSDTRPGVRRRRRGKGFSYIDTGGRTISDPAVRKRIEALAIPPAWTDVWICPSPHGHIQATGRDDRGRKQYIYHPRWSEVSSRTKFDRLRAFGESLTRIRQRVRKDLGQRSLTRTRILAAVVEILDRTQIRVGNREYADENGSLGVTTLRNRNVAVSGDSICFRFRGKGGKVCETGLRDRRLARVLDECHEIPGQELFQYRGEDGEYLPLQSADVNDYLREIAGDLFTAKDFRTWRGTVLAAYLLSEAEPAETKRGANKPVVEALREIAGALANTPAVCRKYYVHPGVVELYLTGELAEYRRAFRPRLERNGQSGSRPAGLDEDERFLLYLLRKLET